MEEEIVKEILEECKGWKERLIVRLFPDLIVRIYHMSRFRTFNNQIKYNKLMQ